MQPQNVGNPDPKYSFIYGNGQKPAKSSKLSLPKPVLLLAGSLVVLAIGIIIAVVIGGRSTNNATNYTSLIARSQEIVRVSDVVKLQTKDADTLTLIATVESALSSEQTQLTTYLTTNGTKIDIKSLAIYLDKSTDAQMLEAQQNNNLSAAYASYVKGELNKYEQELSASYKTAGPKAKPILKEAFDSTKAILAAPQLK